MNPTHRDKQKFKDITILHKRLIERLGDDLVYSIAYDQGNYYLSISTHRSTTQQFSHGRQQQTALLDNFSDSITKLVEELVKLYEPILIEKKEELDEVG